MTLQEAVDAGRCHVAHPPCHQPDCPTCPHTLTYTSPKSYGDRLLVLFKDGYQPTLFRLDDYEVHDVWWDEVGMNDPGWDPVDVVGYLLKERT